MSIHINELIIRAYIEPKQAHNAPPTNVDTVSALAPKHDWVKTVHNRQIERER